jgi:hypothetical protein
MNKGNSLGQWYNRPTGCSAEKAPHATFNFLTTNHYKKINSKTYIKYITTRTAVVM